MGVIADIRARLSLDGKDFERNMLRAERQLDQFRRSVNEQMRRVGIAFAAVSGTAALVGASFEQSMANVRAVTRAGEADLARMEMTARRLGATTSFSARESADAMLVLAQAGLDTNAVIASTEAVLVGAGAGMTDMTLVAELLTQSLKRFNIPAQESARVINVIEAAAERTQTDFERMAESMKFAGTVAGPFGLTLEDTAAGVAILTDRLGDASMAGTGFRRILSGLVDPANKIHDEIQGLDLIGEGFERTLRKIEAANVPIESFMTWFGERGGPAMIQMLSAGADEWAKLRDDITGTNDAFEAYAITQDTMQGAFLRLRSALEEVAIAWTSTFRTRAKQALDAAAEAVNRNKEAIVRAWNTVTEAIFAVGRATVGLVGFFRQHDSTTRVLVGTVLTLTAALYGLSVAQQVVNAVMRANPILLALSAIALGINIVIEKTGGWRNAWIRLQEQARHLGNEIRFAVANWKTGAEEVADGFRRAVRSVEVLRRAFGVEVERMWELAKTFGQGFLLTMFNPRMASFALERFRTALQSAMVDNITAPWRKELDEVWKGFGDDRRADMERALRDFQHAQRDIIYETRLALAQLNQDAGKEAGVGLEELSSTWDDFVDTVEWDRPARAIEETTRQAEESVDSLVSRTERVFDSAWSSITSRTQTATEKWKAIFFDFFQAVWDWIGETIRRMFFLFALRTVNRILNPASNLVPGQAGIDEGFGQIGPDIGPAPAAQFQGGFRSPVGSSAAPDSPARGGDTIILQISGPVIAEDEVGWHRFLDRAERDISRIIRRTYRDPVTVTV